VKATLFASLSVDHSQGENAREGCKKDPKKPAFPSKPIALFIPLAIGLPEMPPAYKPAGRLGYKLLLYAALCLAIHKAKGTEHFCQENSSAGGDGLEDNHNSLSRTCRTWQHRWTIPEKEVDSPSTGQTRAQDCRSLRTSISRESREGHRPADSERA
jgi:hypothetical protein